MAKLKILERFFDKNTDEEYLPGRVVEFEDERAAEIMAALPTYVEPVKERKARKAEEE